MNKKLDDYTKNCFLYQNTLPEWWDLIEAKQTIIKVKKGQKFINEGTETLGIYFIHEGLVKVHKHWGDRELIVRFSKQSEIVGHRAISSGKTLSPISATAMQDSVLCYIDIDFFRTLLKTNNSFAYNLMMFYAEELQWSEQKMGNLVHLSVKDRFKISLKYLINHFGLNDEDFLNIELTKTDLALYVGSTYETIYRVISELEKQNILSFSGKTIKILNESKLSN